MGRWAECLSQTRNFAKARFSEIQRRDRAIIFITRIALLLKSAGSTVAIEPIAPYSIKIFISFCYCTIRSEVCWIITFVASIWLCVSGSYRAGQCRLPECRQKSWRAPLHRLRWLRHHQHYAFDGPCSGCSGRLDNADDVSEIMQRSPVGSRFAVSFCCFNKNENLYGGKEMLYTKV